MNPPLAGERILVVDDEGHIRRLLSRFLTSQGADVAVAPNAEAAIRQLQHRSIDKVVTDIETPPGKSGLWLVQQINDTWPRVKVVVTTACPVLAEKNSGAHTVLLKPYPLPDLVRCLCGGSTRTLPPARVADSSLLL